MIKLLHNELREADDDEIKTVVYESTGSATDSNDNVRVSSIQLGVLGIHTSG